MSTYKHEIRGVLLYHLATLSESGRYSKEVNVISWNEYAGARVDIRHWDTATGHAQKGICISSAEVVPLINALIEYAQYTGLLEREDQGDESGSEFDEPREALPPGGGIKRVQGGLLREP